MAEPRDFLKEIESIAEAHGSFRPEAYLFVLEAVEKAMADSGRQGHISGEVLLECIKQLGRDRYGVMATDVFAAWGVRSTLDFGRCVFHLVDGGLLSKRDEDSLRDFIDKYDFRQVFEGDYFLGRA
ncbi:MAG TPA: hypothetical protein PLL30_07935 [Candidatus Krumholzibacteria bacterium]|nr:hypothetical protein [Candidatus Krumholzibacteria bacterium]HPD71685.1 hypothetical protein [Candidatus Krumholzibacteria bacterium]HRY41382.1 hypothetical protein [Candidatus Krumholzibacteria bacterium]